MDNRLRWTPSSEWISQTNLTLYLHWLERELGYGIPADYTSAWRWSVEQPAAFWTSLLHYFHLEWSYTAAIQGEMPHTRWFEGAMLNYAEEVFRRADDRFPAILFQAEHLAPQEISWAELRTQVGRLTCAPASKRCTARRPGSGVPAQYSTGYGGLVGYFVFGRGLVMLFT